MTGIARMSKAELLAKIEQGWNDFQSYLMSLTPIDVTVPTDPAGWTALDHVMHVADWENGTLALMNRQNRAEAMGLDAAAWAKAWAGDWDTINGLMQQRNKHKSLPEAREFVMGIHQRLIDAIQTLTDDDLYRPYSDYQPDSDLDRPIITWLQSNTYEHYNEHKGYIAKIVSDSKPLSKAELLARVHEGWVKLNTFLASFSPAQLTQPTDAAGWTVKDHMMHLAAWEDGLIGRLNKTDMADHMYVEKAVWEQGDDAINAVIQQRYKDMPLGEVDAKRCAIHVQLLKQIDDLSEPTLQGPYDAYNTQSSSTRSINDMIGGTTYMHYAEHMPWMAAIVADRTPLPKATLVARIALGWEGLNRFLTSLTDAQKTQLTDAAGWTVKDHLAHLSVWEDGVLAVLEQADRLARMGVDEATWNSDDEDRINARIHQQHQADSLSAVESLRHDIHNRLMAKIDTLTDADLQRTLSEYNSSNTVSGLIVGNTYMHYAEHLPWIAAIAQDAITKAKLLARTHASWDALNAYIAALNDVQRTQLTDAAGWTVKDHLIHLAVWEDGVWALLNHRNRPAQMGVNEATWARWNFDEINAVIQQQHKDKSWSVIEAERHAIHDRFVAHIAAMNEAELMRPMGCYNPRSTTATPVIDTIVSDTYSHYDEHKTWIAAIAEGSQ